MKQIVLSIINNGVRAEFDEELKYHIQVTNFIIILCLLTLIPFYLISHLNLNSPILGLAKASLILPAAITWFLLRKGYQKLARLLFATTVPVTVYLLGCFLNINEATYGFAPKMWLVSGVALPFLVLTYDEWKFIIALVTLDLVLLMTFDRANALLNLPGLTINIDTKLMRDLATLCSSMFIAAVILFTKKQLFKKSRELSHKNRLLNLQITKLKEADKKIYNAYKKLGNLHSKLKEQKRLLETTLNNLNESLLYAQTIQSAIMEPRIKILDNYLSDYFLLFKPKEKVGGDFYLFEWWDNKLIIAIGDATGHGVPGALMATLAISTLGNVLRNTITKWPSQILIASQKIVVQTLNQYQNVQKDGFDLALIFYYPDKHQLIYSGANIDLYQVVDDQIIRHKAARKPIGFCEKQEEFKDIVIDVKQNNLFYLFTDGYQDQIGGTHNKKFGRRRFIKLLMDNHNLSLSEQKQILARTIEQWTFYYGSQLDDITVFGFKI